MRILLIALLFLPAACRKKDPVLAQVGSKTVRSSSFLKEVEGVPFSSQEYLRSPSGRKELLELLVRRKIILQEAADRSPAQQGELPKRLARLKESYAAQKNELTRAYLEERDRTMVTHFLEGLRQKTLLVTDDDVRKFWETENELKASHILVSDRAKAENLRARITQGEKFETLAKEHSEDTGSGKRGGDLGYLLKGSLVPEFEKALFSLAPGEISPPVPSPYGYHIIKRTGERPLKNFPLDDTAKARLKQALESQKLQAWFDQTRRRYVVSVHEEALLDMDFPTPDDRAPQISTATAKHNPSPGPSGHPLPRGEGKK